MRLLAVTLALAIVPASAAAEPAKSYASKQGCAKTYSHKAAHRGIAAQLRNHSPLTRAEGRNVWRFSQCAETRRKARSNIRYANRLRAWRHSYAHRWPIAFNRLPAWERAWAWNTGACESGNDPTKNTGNGYHGAHQWLISTWLAAGGTGIPEQHSWYYQAVIAVHWMLSHGDEQWPNCGD